MANCGNELPELRDIARVENPVTHQNIDDAYDQMMFIKVVSLLLARQDGNAEDLDHCRLMDLGRLFFFLAGHPSNVLGDFGAAFNDDDPDPDPGKHKPVLIQSAGGAK